MNYDNDVLGVGNSQHPANQEPEKEEEFYSTDLQECLNHYKDTLDCEPLENAIYENELKLKRANKDLTEAVKLLRSKNYDSTANFLCQLRNDLKK